jgi:hypothetical protein
MQPGEELAFQGCRQELGGGRFADAIKAFDYDKHV